MACGKLLALLSLPLSGRGLALLPDFRFAGGDTPAEHFRLGLAMGSAFREAIQQRAAEHLHLFQEFLTTARGQQIYAELLATHQSLVPHLVKELEGISEGSRLPFRTMFSLSLEQEISHFAPAHTGQSTDHCTDYMLCSAERCLNGHNEDGQWWDRRLFTAFVQLGGASFTTVNYVGDLLGGMSALSFNAAGLAFSLNWVGPPTCLTSGLGRNYVSRLLLETRSWEEALAVLARKHAMGHNYQLMDFGQRRIANVEVANDRRSVRSIAEPFFHVNQYQTLSVPGESVTNSSVHRLRRLRELPAPSNSEEVLRILGDQGDTQYPVFHDERSHSRGELSDWTLATVLFDLDNRTISLMEGNPARQLVRRRFAVPAPRPSELLA